MPTPRSLAALLFLTASVSASACAPAEAPPASAPPAPPPPAAPVPKAPSRAGIDAFGPGARAAAEGIRPEAIASHIRFLADDLLEGREPGTRGFELGSHYVGSELQAMGLVPAGDKGTFFQKVELLGHKIVAASLELSGGSGPPLQLVRDHDFVPSKERTDLAAELVFVGFGLDVPEYHYDDFAGLDVRGKIVVRFYGAPRSDRQDFFPSLASAVYGDGERVRTDLERRGAVGVITLATPEDAKRIPMSRIVQSGHFESMILPGSSDRLPGAFLDGPAFEKLLKKSGRTETLAQLAESANRQATHGFSFGVKARLKVDVAERTVVTENVVGFVPSDPASPTKDEMVLYGAHLDHMGIGDEVKGDRIYNGASDDAAGCASLLETARAFVQLAQTRPLPRRILFTFVTGEERGLLGSKWFAEHPTVPLEDIVADIDVDDAYPISPLKDVIAIGADESALSDDARRAADALGIEVSPESHPEEHYFIRSDNYSFVKKGIPAAQLARGELGLSKEEKTALEAFWKGRYHQPQDEYEPNRDWRPFADYTRFSFLLGLSIAQRKDRPAWNPQSLFRRFPEKGQH